MKTKLIKIIDFILIPFTSLSLLWLRKIRRWGTRTKYSRILFDYFEILPIHDHYYEPLINPKKHLLYPLSNDRKLKGIDFNISEQIKIINSFNYNEELVKFSINKINEVDYFYNNLSFEYGDSEYLYNMIRFYKPKNIIEIGSGYSTRMMVHAVEQNKIKDKMYNCKIQCIEPYEYKTLGKLHVSIIKERVEKNSLNMYKVLKENDILFIDSSHIIRPQGDVLYEIQNILPSLNKGVIIHVHDIFTPKDYPKEWIMNQKLWNEQYLLESFLAFNNSFKIIGSLNYLKHHHWETLASKCPLLKQNKNSEPGSFWIKKIN